jgi:hypothetical protein
LETLESLVTVFFRPLPFWICERSELSIACLRATNAAARTVEGVLVVAD